jgi:hypothetical protein
VRAAVPAPAADLVRRTDSAISDAAALAVMQVRLCLNSSSDIHCCSRWTWAAVCRHSALASGVCVSDLNCPVLTLQGVC